jgi:hypothetical protein
VHVLLLFVIFFFADGDGARPEVAVLSPNNTGTRPAVEHDILEVNNYIMSGLMVSSIDKWFMGPVPRFTPQDLGVPSDDYGLHKALASCHTAINDKTFLEWQGVRIMKFWPCFDCYHLFFSIIFLSLSVSPRMQTEWRRRWRQSGEIGERRRLVEKVVAGVTTAAMATASFLPLARCGCITPVIIMQLMLQQHCHCFS